MKESWESSTKIMTKCNEINQQLSTFLIRKYDSAAVMSAQANVASSDLMDKLPF